MRKAIWLAGAAMLSAASTAFAAEIWNHAWPASGSLKWNGFDSGNTAVQVQKTNGPTVSYNGSGGQYGGYFYTDGAPSDDEFFRFFCIDLFQVAASGPLPYTASIHVDDRLARLFDIAYPNKSLGDFYDGASTAFGQFSSNVLSSAFQLAVWELVYETDAIPTLTAGSFRSLTAGNASGTAAQQAVAQAEQWLGLVQAGAGSAAGWTLYRFVNPNRQDYLAATYSEPVTTTSTVLEPGTLAMMSLGLGALAALRRRQRRLANGQDAAS